MSSDSPIAMNWDCARQGCFNRKKRLKFAVFADCLPGKISFTDVDGLVEIGGNLLFLEWKDHQRLGTGQRILFQRLTRFCPATVLIVEGDAEDMSVEAMATAWGGQIGPFQAATLKTLREAIRQWSNWALVHPAGQSLRISTCN